MVRCAVDSTGRENGVPHELTMNDIFSSPQKRSGTAIVLPPVLTLVTSANVKFLP